MSNRRPAISNQRYLLAAGCFRHTAWRTRHGLWRGLLAAVSLAGCVHQELIVRTTPPGAAVYYNGRLVGTSPLTHEFLWYEPYQVRVEKAGFPPLQENGVLKAPPWMWFPMDGLMVITPLPLTDRHYTSFDFEHPSPAQVAAAIESKEHPPQTHTGILDDLRRIHQQR